MQKDDEKGREEDEEIVQLVEKYISRSSPQNENDKNDIVFQNFSVTGAGVGVSLIEAFPLVSHC
jgi:hypothetical protein